MNIHELCGESGFKEAEIRYFVRSGLIDPPSGKGRGSCYSNETLETLKEIKRLRDLGCQASVMRERIVSRSLGPWHRYVVTPGLEVLVQRNIERQWRVSVAATRRVLEAFFEDDKKGEASNHGSGPWHRYVVTPGLEILAECNAEKEWKNSLPVVWTITKRLFSDGKKDEREETLDD